MEAHDSLDITYLITVLAVNGLGFFIVVICYAQIYFSLGTETRTRSTTSGEMTVAKKMALLVRQIESVERPLWGLKRLFYSSRFSPTSLVGLRSLSSV